MQPITSIDTGKDTHEMQYDRSIATAFKNISFGGSVNPNTSLMESDNMLGVWTNVVSEPLMTITHNLGHPPVGFLVMSKNAPCDVYFVSSDDTQISLGASVTGINLTLFILG